MFFFAHIPFVVNCAVSAQRQRNGCNSVLLYSLIMLLPLHVAYNGISPILEMSKDLQHVLHLAFDSDLSRDNQSLYLYLSFRNHSSRQVYILPFFIFRSGNQTNLIIQKNQS